MDIIFQNVKQKKAHIWNISCRAEKKQTFQIKAWSAVWKQISCKDKFIWVSRKLLE